MVKNYKLVTLDGEHFHGEMVVELGNNSINNFIMMEIIDDIMGFGYSQIGVNDLDVDVNGNGSFFALDLLEPIYIKTRNVKVKTFKSSTPLPNVSTPKHLFFDLEEYDLRLIKTFKLDSKTDLKKIFAIKKFREDTGLSLREGKEYVDQLINIVDGIDEDKARILNNSLDF